MGSPSWKAEMHLRDNVRHILRQILELTGPREQTSLSQYLATAKGRDVVFVPLRSDVICRAITNIVAARVPSAVRMTIQGNGVVLASMGPASFQPLRRSS